MKDNYDNYFSLPTAPRSDWETFLWIFKEPTLLERYSKTLSKKQALFKIAKIYLFYIVPLVCIIYLLGILFILASDAWTIPGLFKTSIIEGLDIQNSSIVNVQVLIQNSFFSLAFGLALGLALGLAYGLAYGLALGLAGGLALGLALGLAYGLALGLAGGLALGLAGGLAGGLALGLAFGLAFGLALGLAFGLGLGLASGLAGGVAGGVAFGLAFGFSYILFTIRPWNTIYYYFKYISKISFDYNPYFRTEGNIIPIGVNELLINAKKEPLKGLAFAKFLLEYRQPHQGKLAIRIQHSANSQLFMTEKLIRSEDLRLSVIPAAKSADNKTIWINYFESYYAYRPSQFWIEAFDKFRNKLSEYELARQFKRRALKEVQVACDELINATIQDDFKGREEYLPAFRHWKKQLEAAHTTFDDIEKITFNPYAKGQALSPYHDTERAVFMEREDVRDELAQKVLNSARLPLLLIQGQRRLGKTSLLKFVESLLGTGYIVVIQDFDTLAGADIITWLKDLRRKVVLTLKIQEDSDWQPSGSVLDAWTEFADFLKTESNKLDKHIILAFDEYEKFQDRILKKDPEVAQDLLWRIRGFLQEQQKVVMLFVGADSFSDFDEPNWTKVFVQRHVIQIGYLSKEATLKLITDPTEGYKLQYEAQLPERLWELTQGHPHLIQAICSDLVDRANRLVKNPVTFEDLQVVIEQDTLIDTPPFDVFWNEFCHKREMKETVLRIVKGEKIEKNSQIIRLLEHKYVREVNGKYEMWVPLFQMWLERYGVLD